jgi:hypothetical protein
MLGRAAPVTLPVLICACSAALGTAGRAQAHRLNAEAILLPNQKIQIESWFSTGQAAKGAKVEVFEPSGQLLTKGLLDEQGIFVFSYGVAQTFKVVISASPEHRKELTIPEADLAARGPRQNFSAKPIPLAERSSGISVKDVILGVAFLLALSSFWLSLRNARKLRQWSLGR